MKCIKSEEEGHEVDGVGVEDGDVRSVLVCIAQCGDSASLLSPDSSTNQSDRLRYLPPSVRGDFLRQAAH